MSSLDLDLDMQMSNLEFEWRRVYEASMDARAEYQTMAANPTVGVESLDAALDKLDRAEARKARIMAKIERLENSMLGRD